VRIDSRYYAYGGRSTARIRQLKLALSSVGWDNYQPVVPVTMSRLPMVRADPVATSPPSGVKTGLEFSWADRGGQLNLKTISAPSGRMSHPRGTTTCRRSVLASRTS
jgi:hypothetical protein